MSETSTSTTNGHDGGTLRERARLSFDLDVDICIVGAGLAGLTVALEAARLGASVAVLEGRHVGWNASGHQLGTVMPGFGLPIADLIARIGFEDTRELWALSKQGAESIRANATEQLMPGIALSEGALEVSNVDVGDQLISRLQMLGGGFRNRSGRLAGRSCSRSSQDRPLFPRHLLSQGVSGRRAQIRPRSGGAGAAGGGADFRGHAGRQHRFIRHSQAYRNAIGAVARVAHRARRQHPSRRAATAAVANAAAGLALRRGDRAAWRTPRRGHDVSGFGDRHRRRRPFPDREWRPPDVGQSGNHLECAAGTFCARYCAPDPYDFSPAWAGRDIRDLG